MVLKIKFGILLLVSILFFSNCASKKTITNCKTIGKVVDLKGKDGCNLLIEIGNKRYKPIFQVPKPELENEALISLDFNQANGVMSTCPSESGSILVNCIKIIKNPCPKFISINDLPWLSDLKQKMRPQKITYYQNEMDEDIFVLDMGKYKYLYNCKGILDCTAATDDVKSDCYAKFASMKNGATLFNQ